MGHHRVGGTNIEVVVEGATISQSERGTKTATQETALHLCAETVLVIKVVITTQQ